MLFSNRLSSVALATFLWLLPPGVSQAETTHNESLWLTYGMQYAIHPDWRLSMHIQPYWREQGQAYDQVTYRPGIYYSPNPLWSIGGGYAYYMNYPEARSTVHEHRWWGDVIRNVAVSDALTLTVRSRLERRYIEDQVRTVNAIREMLRLNVALNSRWQLVVSDEWYYTLNHTDTIAHGFDQNRLFVGMATTLSAQSTLEFGVLDQYAKRSVHDTDTLAWCLTLNQRF